MYTRFAANLAIGVALTTLAATCGHNPPPPPATPTVGGCAVLTAT